VLLGSAFNGHPLAGSPHYGVVAAEAILYAAPLLVTPRNLVGWDRTQEDPIYHLVTDMWEV